MMVRNIQVITAPDGWPLWTSEGNFLLKTTFKALRNVSLCTWRIGAIVAAALVILHIELDRTT